VRVIDTTPVPALSLNTLPTYGSGWMSDAPNMLDFATVSFDYAGDRSGQCEPAALGATVCGDRCR